MKKAFTLIELLVVVLIIGILASVALPGYQTAVEKSQFVQYIQALKNIQEAQEIYYMSRGKYAVDLTELDINATGVCPILYPTGNMLFGCKGGGYINNVRYDSVGPRMLVFTYCPRYSSYVTIDNYAECNKKPDVVLKYYYKHSPDYTGALVECSGHTTSGRKLCLGVSR